jgi:putative transcriptional regulator
MKHARSTKSVGQEMLASLSEFETALQAGVPIAKQFTVRSLSLDLRPAACSSQEVKTTRQTLGASQAIFAQFLGVSVQAVRAWEQGDKAPRGVACRFMDEIRRDPKYWRKRLRAVSRVKPGNGRG